MKIDPKRSVGRLGAAQRDRAELDGHFNAFVKSFADLPGKDSFFNSTQLVQVDTREAVIRYEDITLRFAMQVRFEVDQEFAIGVVLCLLDCPLRTGSVRPWLLDSFAFDTNGICALETGSGKAIDMDWCAPLVVADCIERALAMKPSPGSPTL